MSGSSTKKYSKKASLAFNIGMGTTKVKKSLFYLAIRINISLFCVEYSQTKNLLNIANNNLFLTIHVLFSFIL